MQNLTNPDYDPNSFIDWLIAELKLKNDAALARLLETSPVTISKVRHHCIPMPAAMLISIHEETGLRTTEIKARMFRQQVAA